MRLVNRLIHLRGDCPECGKPAIGFAQQNSFPGYEPWMNTLIGSTCESGHWWPCGSEQQVRTEIDE